MSCLLLYCRSTYLVDNFHAIDEGHTTTVIRVGERHDVHPSGSDRDPAGDYVELPLRDGSDDGIGGHRAIRNGDVVRKPEPIRKLLVRRYRGGRMTR